MGFLAPIAGAVVGSLISKKLAPKDKSVEIAAATNAQNATNLASQTATLEGSKLINAGGLTSAKIGGKLNVTASSSRTSLVRNLSNVLKNTSQRFGKLGAQIRPGFSELRRVGLANLQGERQRVIGSLKDNLARRRISGSSFASDAVSRAEAEFQKREDEFTAQTFLQEIDAQANLIQTESQFAAASVETFITELNIEAETALQLTGLANAGIAQLAAAQTSALTALSQSTIQGAQAQASDTRELTAAGLGFGASFIEGADTFFNSSRSA